MNEVQKTVCELNKCMGCMACLEACSHNAISIKDNLKAYNAVIDSQKCIECGACHTICQQNHNLDDFKIPARWYQGWCKNESIRVAGSSGGIAGAVSLDFVKSGGIVCSCVLKKGKFVFDFAENEAEVVKFTGSKYVKSNPEGIYSKIKYLLEKRKKLLFIGLPCQVAAIKKMIPVSMQENLYTVDLICHGTPSPKMLDIFLGQYDKDIKQINDISFRKKAKFQVFVDGRGVITQGVTDRYLVSFLNSMIYTENCYSCPYARRERISDITLGDSWGSDLDYLEQKKGISLVLVQTPKGKSLIESDKFVLKKVDIENAIIHNHQLRAPSTAPENREDFFERLNNKNFNKLISGSFPYICFKQDIKKILINTGLKK